MMSGYVYLSLYYSGLREEVAAAGGLTLS